MNYKVKTILLTIYCLILFGKCGLNQSPAIIGGAVLPLVASSSVKLNGAIQSSEIALTGSVTTILLSRKVISTRSILLCNFKYGGSALSYAATCKLNSNGDSIIIETGGEFSGTTAHYSLLEFSTGVNVLRNEFDVTSNNTGGIATFIGSQLDLSKNLVVHSSRVTSSSTSLDSSRLFKSTFNSSSALEFSRNILSVGVSAKIVYQKLQIDESIIQSGEVTLSSASDTITKTINQVNLNKSILLFSINADTNVSGVESNYFIKGGFQNSSSIQFERKGTSGNIIISYYVLEFTGSVNVISGSSTVSNGITKSTTSLSNPLTSYENSLLIFNNNITSGSSPNDSLDSSSFTGFFSNSGGTEAGNSHITFERVRSENNSAEINYQAIEFTQK